MNAEKETFISNKIAVIHVLAGLISEPLLFSNSKYRFDIEDFPEAFHQILFGAIQNLAIEGMEKISAIDIDQYLKNYTVQYKVFNDNHGISYIQNILEMYQKEKFDYYYENLKKYSLINKLNKQGIDTKEVYDPDIIDPIKNAEMYAKFDKMSVADIVGYFEEKIVEIKEDFISNSDRAENKAGDGLRELKERLKQRPDIGLPLFSPKLTTIFRGQRLGCLFIESAPSGSGKSRRGNSEACHLAVPEYYNVQQKSWVRTNLQERVLVISTELEEYECQQMWMAFVAGVSEAHIKDGEYEFGEEERVDHAIELIEKSNLFFVSITNYDTDDIIDIIKKYKQLYQVKYVFFDYLGETLKITSSATKKTKVQGLRTDQVLLMLSSALKDVAKTENIYIWTASQLSGDYKNAKDLDSSFLRSAKSISDKVDCGSILMPVREIDQPIIDSYLSKGFELAPNFVISVYKVRAGSYQNIKVYVYFDRGTCQMTDCFVTDSRGNFLQIEDANIDIIIKNTKENNFGKAYTNNDNLDVDFDF